MKLIFMLLLSCFVLNNTSASLKIILKLDDLMVWNNGCASIPTMDYLIQKQVKFSTGIIALNCDNTAPKLLKPYMDATNSNGDKLLEIWHHGLDHVIPEFSSRTYDYQKQHFENADQIVNNLIGVQMHTFGAPGNSNDSISTTVLSENPNFKVYLFANVIPIDTKGILYLNNRCDMENVTGNPNYDFFLSNYNKYKNSWKEYMVLQGHPNGWTTDKLEQFKLIIDFLIDQGCEFVLPYDYYRSLTNYPPTNLKVEVTSKQVNLSWDDNSSSEYNYKIERSTDGKNWFSIGTCKENSKSYTDDHIPPISDTFYYRVYANCGIKSGYSNVATSMVASICQGSYYDFKGTLLYDTGTYSKTLTSSLGGDSIVSLKLFVNNATTSTINATSCDSYTLNGQRYTSNGIYTQKMANIAGCDSIITLNLILNNASTNSIRATACDKFALNGRRYSSSGTYTQKLTSVTGCDSIITLNLIVGHPTTNTIYETANDSITFNGYNYKSSGSYRQILTNTTGCDSLINLNLTIKHADTTSIIGEQNAQDSNFDLEVLPNLCVGKTTIKWKMPKSGIVSCAIYSLSGKLERTLFYGQYAMGIYQFPFDVSDFQSGIYFCHLNTPDGFSTVKIVIRNN